MMPDLNVDLIHATVQLEQPLGDGTRTVGTGFLINAPGPHGEPRTVLVTAAHVFEKMPLAQARVGYRVANADGSWTYAPAPLEIRQASGEPRWTKHPGRDIAVMSIKAPDRFVKAAIPLAWLADDQTFERARVSAGDEMMALGFPRGLSANGAGFPILRSGKVASYPLGPASIFPTFLLDFSVFPGNSGGPVFMAPRSRDPAETAPLSVVAGLSAQTGAAAAQAAGQEAASAGLSEPAPRAFIAGLLTQQVELNQERLEIGIVTHARFIREAIRLLDAAEPPQGAPARPAPAQHANAAGAASAEAYASTP